MAKRAKHSDAVMTGILVTKFKMGLIDVEDLEELAKNADRVWYFDEGPRASLRLISKEYPKAERSQTTLEAFS